MKKVKWLGAITVLSGAALTLTACGNNNNNNASDKKVSFKEAVPKKQVKKGGTLKYAIESDSPFTVFSYQNYLILLLIVKFKHQV